MLDEIRDWGWAIVLGLGVLYAAFRDKLGMDFVRARQYERDGKARDDAMKELRDGTEAAKHLAAGAHDKLGDMARRQDAIESRVETIDEHGSAPTREVLKALSELTADMREVKTHLKYLRNHHHGRDT